MKAATENLEQAAVQQKCRKLEERERNTIAGRIKDARLPRMKTLDDFDFQSSAAGARDEDPRTGPGQLIM